MLGVLPALLLTSGCGMPTASPPVGTSPPPRPSVSAPDAGGSRQAAPGVPDSLGAPVASRTAAVSSDGASQQVALDVYRLHRDERWVRLTARLRVLRAPAGAVAPAALLGSNPQDALTDSQPDGFTLTDTAAGLRYRPAVDISNRPLCSPQLPTSWSSGDVIYVACIFGAPAAASVTVTAPTFGEFAHVPVT